MKFTLEQTDFSKICQNPELPLWYISPDTNERTVTIFAGFPGVARVAGVAVKYASDQKAPHEMFQRYAPA